MASDFDQKSFFSFEKKHNLFNLKLDQLYFWDLIRFDLYYHLLWNFDGSNKKGTNRSIRISKAIQEASRFIWFLLFRKIDYLFFTTSRNNIDTTKFFDQNLGDIINNIPGKYIALESFERDSSKWYYNRTLFNPVFLVRRISKVFYKKNDFSDIINLINLEYENSKFSNDDINRIVIDFKIDLIYYSFILKIKKPKIIFITQNGIQKGLFAAAIKCKIPVIEMQHGIIDEGHLSYSYNKNIIYTPDQVYLPEYFFTFSDFWSKELYFPVKEIVSIGNSFIYNVLSKSALSNKPGGLLIASSDVFGQNLKELAIEFAKRNTTTPIYFKLHPNQFEEAEHYINEFSKFGNIKVYTNDKSIYELITISDSLLVIQSTALYEALHSKNKVLILKKQSYHRHKHVFNLPNVFLIENVDDLIESIKKSYINNSFPNEIFFKKFELEKFKIFINKIISDN